MAVSPDVLFKALEKDVNCVLSSNLKVGDSWTPEMNSKDVAGLMLGKSLLKKYLASKRTTPEQDAVATRKFHDANMRCANWEFAPNTSLDEELMGQFKQLLYLFFYPTSTSCPYTNLDAIFDSGRTGPGASVGARGNDFYTKLFSSPLLCTNGLLKTHYLYALQRDDLSLWRDADSNRELAYGEIALCEGSRFSFVPKDVGTSRLIAIEPALNMFYQLGFGRLLEQGLKTTFGLDIAAQPQINQFSAWFGSVTNSLSTIDLSEASDSISNKMLAWALPKEVYLLLQRFRSPKGLLAGKQVELNMVSTMGNGYTFPLETLIFSCCVISAIQSYGYRPERPGRDLDTDNPADRNRLGYWGVFGDDIICHRNVTDRVLRLLGLLGFKVNRDKSYVDGPFRESCGRDYYLGHDVRGVYIKTLATEGARYAAINALNVWSAKTGIRLPETIKLLMSSVKYLPVPPEDNHDAGVRVPFSCLKITTRDGNQALIYERRISSPAVIRIGDGFVKVPKGFKDRIFNPEGLLTAFLEGSVRGGRIMVRTTKTRYRTKRGVTPRWDYTPPTSDIASLCGFPLWERAVESHLFP